MRAHTGLLNPKYGVPGYYLDGQVESLGSAAKRFQPGAMG
jgi:hypothetical protein